MRSSNRLGRGGKERGVGASDVKGALGRGAKSSDIPVSSVNKPVAIVVAVTVVEDDDTDGVAKEATTWVNCETDCCSTSSCCCKSPNVEVVIPPSVIRFCDVEGWCDVATFGAVGIDETKHSVAKSWIESTVGMSSYRRMVILGIVVSEDVIVN